MLITEYAPTIEACRFCFMCRHVCTLGVVTGKESDTPRGKGLILFKASKGHIEYTPDTVDAIYRCCLCGLCETWCKAGCHMPDTVLAARADIVAQGKEPIAARQIKDNLLNTGNPFGRPAAERFQTLGAAEVGRPKAEVLYYVGCETAYQRPQIAASVIKILRQAGIDFSLLPEEHSTGKPLRLLGYRDEARRMAESLVAKIRATGCKTLVTACPSAVDAFRRDYPAMGLAPADIEVLHAAEYLERLAGQDRLCLRRSVAGSAAVLDGTYLGRTHRLFDPPRRLLGRIPGLELREMGWTRELAHACGESGGVLRLLHPELSAGLATRVLAEAAVTKADMLVTTCPVSQITLQEADGQGPRVRDLMEVVAESLEL